MSGTRVTRDFQVLCRLKNKLVLFEQLDFTTGLEKFMEGVICLQGTEA